MTQDRLLTDNVTFAFASLFHAICRGEADRAEQVIVGTPFRMIAYRAGLSGDSETFHFEIRPQGVRGLDTEPVSILRHPKLRAPRRFDTS